MEKPKVRLIVGWRERESQVRRNKGRMRASAGAFKPAASLATTSVALKKKA